MILRYFYDEKLAHASYLVGCQKTGDAIVIDPGRNLEPYLKTAELEGVNIVAATETHIHADFVSGSRELAETYSTKLYLSGEGGEHWQYQFTEGINHRLIMDGDKFFIGNLHFEVMHTPGHTPESISLLLTDRGSNADSPMGIFTGDFVFVGDVGRPDLLEVALGQKGSSYLGAEQMFESIKKFKELPDYLQVWPAHGAGSACGKDLGAIPTSTVGYEKRFNWALKNNDKGIFCKELMEGQSNPPRYFKSMKHINKNGPTLIKDLTIVKEINSITYVKALLEDNSHVLIDTRTSQEFAKSHIKGSINIPYIKSFLTWMGSIVDINKSIVILTNKETVSDVKTSLYSIGVDHICGYIDISKLLKEIDYPLEKYEEVSPLEVINNIEKGNTKVLDVRNVSEWESGHISNAYHIPLESLSDRLDELDNDKPIVINCRTGIRSAIAVSILLANGMKQVTNLSGGFEKWKKDGLPVQY